MSQFQFMTLANLQLYNAKLTEKTNAAITAAVAGSIKTVSISGNTLYFYSVEEPVGEVQAKYSITLPQQDLSVFYTKTEIDTKFTEVNASIDATNNTVNEHTGKITALEQNKANKTDVTKEINEAVKTETDRAIAAESGLQTAIDGVKTSIGTVETGKTVVQMIEDAKVAATYDDTKIKADIAANKKAISDEVARATGKENELKAEIDSVTGKVTTLIGADADKSVRTIANEELTKQLIPEDAKVSLNTLIEIAAWIQSHPDDASAMNQAITALRTLVGTIPEGVTATNIVAYIQEVVKAEKDRAESAENAIADRVTTLEGEMDTLQGSNHSHANKELLDSYKQTEANLADAVAKKHNHANATELNKIVDGDKAKWDGAVTKADANEANITALDGRIDMLEGNTYEGIPDADILAIFA